MNPRFGRLVERAEDWQFSSYREYLFGGKVPEVQDEIPESTQARRSEISGISKVPRVATDFVLSHFDGVEDYRKFVESFADERMRQIEEQLWK